MPHNLLRLDDQLCFALYAASRAMSQAYRPLLEELGLTYPQYLALLVLWEHDGLSVSAIGDRLQLDSGTLTPLLKRLEQAGLVLRARDDEDERVVVVRLSPAGKKLRLRAEQIPPAMLACTGLSPTELASLRGAVNRLSGHVRQATFSSPKPADHAVPPSPILNTPRKRKTP